MISGMEVRFLMPPLDGERRHIGLPQGVVRLAFPESSEAAPVLLPGAASRGEPVVEIVRDGSRPLVLLRRGAAESVRVNGLPAAELSVLRLRDEVRIGARDALHLTVWCETRIGPAPEERQGDLCPVCRTPLAQAPVYQCPCGLFLHLMGDEVPERDRLECARTRSTCSQCEQEIRLVGGYLYEPEA